MDNSGKALAEPIIAEDFDGSPGQYFSVCPACRIMINFMENPCGWCGQQLDWSKHKKETAQS